MTRTEKFNQTLKTFSYDKALLQYIAVRGTKNLPKENLSSLHGGASRHYFWILRDELGRLASVKPNGEVN